MLDRRSFVQFAALLPTARLLSVAPGGDATAAIQAAIDALGAGGGVVQLEPGVYDLTARGVDPADPHTGYALRIRREHGPVALVGAGDATVLRLAPNQPAHTAAILIHGDGLSSRRTAHTRIAHLRITSGAQPAWQDFGLITALCADGLTCDDLTIDGAPLFGIHVLRGTTDTTIRQCRMTASMAGAAVALETRGARIVESSFVAVSGAGAVSLAYNADVGIADEDILIRGNRFTGGIRQLTVSGARRVIVESNLFRDVTNPNGQALVVEPFASSLGTFTPSMIPILGNQFSSVRMRIILNAASQCLVANNQIVAGSVIACAHGIWEYGGAAQNLIVNNQLIGCVA